MAAVQNLDITSTRIFRYSVTGVLSVALAMGFDWDLSYLTPALALSLVSSATPPPDLKNGIGFVAVIALSSWLAFMFGELLLPFPALFLTFCFLILLHLHYAQGVLPKIILFWLLLSLLIIPLIQSLGVTTGQAVVISLITNGAAAILVVRLAYWIFPQQQKELSDQKQDQAVQLPSKAIRFRRAFEVTVVVMPILVLFHVFQWAGDVLILVYVALLSTQPGFAQNFKGGQALITGNMMGGGAAIILFNLLTIVPEYIFLLLLTSLTGLWFGRCFHAGLKTSPLFGTAYSTLLLILCSVTGSGNSGEAETEVVTRVLQLLVAVVYVVTAFGLLHHLRQKYRE